MSRTIAMISDFGYRDHYVGTMKAVINGICPEATPLDICHEVPAHNVMSGSYVIASATPFLPAGTIVLGVVDPGVGTNRRAVAVQTENHFFIGPDNGLFNMAYDLEPPVRAVELNNAKYQLENISRTFHGRDIFSPAAAHLAAGVELSELGDEIEPESLVRLPEIGPMIGNSAIECRVVHIDHFGNVVTNLSRAVMEAAGKSAQYIRVGETRAPFAETFADVPKNEPVAYFNSSDFLELGIRNGSAAEQLELQQRHLIHLETK